MALLGSELFALILFIVFILPVGTFVSSLASCIMKSADEEHHET